MTSEQQGSTIVVGAGPGIGASVARRFGAEGHAIGLVSRRADRLEELAGPLRERDLTVEIEPADIRDPEDLESALGRLAGRLPAPEVLCFSPLPDVDLIRPVAETTAQDLGAALELNVVGVAAAVQALLPELRNRASSSILFTTGGAALEPSSERAVSGVVYGAQAVYARLLGDALAEDGVFVSQTTIFGPVGSGSKHEPDDVAEHLWQRHLRRDEPLTTLR